jgi:hypothetical protein
MLITYEQFRFCNRHLSFADPGVNDDGDDSDDGDDDDDGGGDGGRGGYGF